METKLALPENTDKEDWRMMTPEELLARVLDEVAETATSMARRDAVAARIECADAANMLMMLWDKLGQP
jgi:hypothetical protein